MKSIRLLSASFLAITCLLVLSCAKENDFSNQNGQSGFNFPTNPFTSDFNGDMGDYSNFANSYGTPAGGQASMTPIENSGLQNLIAELENVNPQQEGVGDLPPEILAALDQILAQEAKGADMFPQKMALAGQMLVHCSGLLARYAPQPGETLIGDWSGSCSISKSKSRHSHKSSNKWGSKGKSVHFSVRGMFAGKFTSNRGFSRIDTVNRGFSSALPIGPAKFIVEGRDTLPYKDKRKNAISGALQPAPNGVATVKAGMWTGVLTDVPTAGSGQMFKQDGQKGCKANVKLTHPANMIPEKYVEAMKQAGQCFRQALFLMSPVMDDMFNGMDPQLAHLLKARMLGLE